MDGTEAVLFPRGGENQEYVVRRPPPYRANPCQRWPNLLETQRQQGLVVVRKKHSAAETNRCHRLMGRTNDADAPVVTRFHTTILYRHLFRLQENIWLNDEVLSRPC